MRVMAVGAHPDDIELTCGGLVAKLAASGHRVGIADLTCGEMGSSGNEKTRISESKKAARALRVSWRVCCGLPDSELNHSDRAHVHAFVRLVRKHRPALVLAPWRESRHPDHIEASEIVRRGLFLAGLRRLPVEGSPHGQCEILYYMGDVQFEPTIIVDIEKFFSRKMKAIEAYRSQFDRKRPDSFPTRLNLPGFLELIEMRARRLGQRIGTRYAEGFIYEGPLCVDDPVELIARGKERV